MSDLRASRFTPTAIAKNAAANLLRAELEIAIAEYVLGPPEFEQAALGRIQRAVARTRSVLQYVETLQQPQNQ